MVYTANQDTVGVREIYSVPLDGSASPTKLNGTLPSGGGVNDSFQISPDSSRVVYTADQDTNEVYEIYSACITQFEANDIWGNIKVNENPVERRRVILKQSLETRKITRTNRKGNYSFDNAVSGKSFRVIIKGPVFSAGAGTDVSGCIKLNGIPVKKRKVVLRQNGETNKVTRTDRRGCYSFDNVVTGKPFKVIIRGPVVP